MQIMQQSGAPEVRILTENLYKFHVLGANKLIREFSDKGCNVQGRRSLWDRGDTSPQYLDWGGTLSRMSPQYF